PKEPFMTEQEWLECRDPDKMLAHLGKGSSKRKVRLLACACCRRFWGLLPAAAQEMLLVAERYADKKGNTASLPTSRRQLYLIFDRCTRAVHMAAYRHESLDVLKDAIRECRSVMAFEAWESQIRITSIE